MWASSNLLLSLILSVILLSGIASFQPFAFADDDDEEDHDDENDDDHDDEPKTLESECAEELDDDDFALQGVVADLLERVTLLEEEGVGGTGPQGDPGPPGDAGTSCTVTSTPTGATISCSDGTSADVTDGAGGLPGDAGTSCTVTSTPTGATISCSDGTSADITDGAGGLPGADGINCWDLNANGVGDDLNGAPGDEDVNNDNVVDVRDCTGPPGAAGDVTLSAILAALSVVPELCDGVDNNIDSQIDEGFPDKGNVCFSAGLGECRNEGISICTTDGTGTVCTALPPGSPVTEICSDGKDNDCDGLTDEAFRAECIISSIQFVPNFCVGSGLPCSEGGIFSPPILCPIISCVR